jgi:hypothetical protein
VNYESFEIQNKTSFFIPGHSTVLKESHSEEKEHDINLASKCNEVRISLSKERQKTPERGMHVQKGDQYPKSSQSKELFESRKPIIDSTHLYELSNESIQRIKRIIFAYFFTPEVIPCTALDSDSEFAIIKIFICKKLVHDKKKSNIHLAIRNLEKGDLQSFLLANPAVNRKNIIKSNVFKRVWKILEGTYKSNFSSHFFSEVADCFPSDAFSIKVFRKNHSFNLSDEFYCRCLHSKEFRKEFFETLGDPSFTEGVLRQSRQKFLNSFDSWVRDSVRFLINVRSPFDRRAKLPDFKFGISAGDLEIVAQLFKKLVPADRQGS